ncbi:hypothetical protein EVAR_7614_1 [Eumeta japonica]|uniref:Uncharacterized protein n=1 Tax=Eumeta variegata TaxID=151549 RepID=A0A4C1TKQ0_EUMVA|nr:hypothetical protein EVAR_7614_1 [Eumeta japonica]
MSKFKIVRAAPPRLVWDRSYIQDLATYKLWANSEFVIGIFNGNVIMKLPHTAEGSVHAAAHAMNSEFFRVPL